MATAKRRIPVTLPLKVEKELENFAKNHGLSLSQAILLLMEHGMETTEDLYWSNLADIADEKTESFASHKEFWNEVLDEQDV